MTGSPISNTNIWRMVITLLMPLDLDDSSKSQKCILMFSYLAAELRNQLKLNCVEKGKILDNIIEMFFGALGPMLQSAEKLISKIRFTYL